jgi:hypothetical protein
MKKFIIKTVWFTIPLIVLFVTGFSLPPTPRASQTLYFASLKKDSLLKVAVSPRIIFIGGSNVSFGLNSQAIKDSLNLNPINTGIHAGIGLKYMLDNVIQYIKAGDIIVLMPEYPHFQDNFYEGEEALFNTVFDVNKKNMKLLSFRQIFNGISSIIKISFSRFNPLEYLRVKVDEVYSVNSFNQYGDVYTHWDKERKWFAPSKLNYKFKFNMDVIQKIKDFQNQVSAKGATMLISYPSFQDISFSNSKDLIKRVEEELLKTDFIILGTPERYMMPDSLMFNSTYHLNKKGVDYRTQLFIEDFKEYLLQAK